MSSLRSNLFLVALGLSMLGLVMVYSATYSEVGTDFLFVRIGHMVLGVAAFFWPAGSGTQRGAGMPLPCT